MSELLVVAGREDRIAAIDRERAYARECDHRVVNADGKLEATVETIDKIMATG